MEWTSGGVAVFATEIIQDRSELLEYQKYVLVPGERPIIYSRSKSPSAQSISPELHWLPVADVVEIGIAALTVKL